MKKLTGKEFLDEDYDEREIFNVSISNVGGNSLRVIRLALLAWAEDNLNNRYGKHCVIMANELTKHIKNDVRVI